MNSTAKKPKRPNNNKPERQDRNKDADCPRTNEHRTRLEEELFKAIHNMAGIVDNPTSYQVKRVRDEVAKDNLEVLAWEVLVRLLGTCTIDWE